MDDRTLLELPALPPERTVMAWPHPSGKGTCVVPGYAPDDIKAYATMAVKERDARIAELEAALRPFAEMATKARDWDKLSGTTLVRSEVQSPYGQPLKWIAVTVGDFRRAAAAMAGGPTQAAGQHAASGQEGLVHGGCVGDGGPAVPGE